MTTLDQDLTCGCPWEQQLVSLDEQTEDDQPCREPSTQTSPESIYEQSWATSLFRQAQERLEEEYAAAGKTSLFGHLKAFLDRSPGLPNYQAVASQLSMTANAVGVAVHRMRHRLGEPVRSEIARTLIEPTQADIEAELRYLLPVLGR